MKFNKNAFSSINDKKYRNWDGYSLIYTYPFLEKIKNKVNLNDINIIFDIGSRDCCQSLEFCDWFPQSQIYAFEPTPKSAEWCFKAVEKYKNIHFFDSAISQKDGFIDFYEVTNGNIGASSILKKNDRHHYGSQYEQKKITISSIKAKTFIEKNNINNVDLIWMDVQGAEIDVLSSFEDCLNNVKAIHTEVGLSEIYEKATIKNELINFMESKNFYVESILDNNLGIEQDIIFINKKYKNSQNETI
jgi:FkbM family methyltransferase